MSDGTTTVEDAIDEIDSSLTWKTLTHSAATVQTINESVSTIVIQNSAEIKQANEVLIPFTEWRFGSVFLARGAAFAVNTYVTSDSWKCCSLIQVGWSDGTIYIGCPCNTWGLSVVPCKIKANTIRYR